MQKFIISLVIVFSTNAWAQGRIGTTRLVSEVDQSLALRQVAVATAQDNVNGLYSGPLGQALVELVDLDTQLNLATLKTEKSYSPEDLQENSAVALELLNQAQAQGLLSLRIERGTRGTRLFLGLSTLPEGKILILERTEPKDITEVNVLKKELLSLYNQMKKRIPYHGLVMSRRGNDITLNIGSDHGVKVGETLDITQIIEIERHPRFDFMISSAKTILGTAEVMKVDEALSFARITKERAPGTITVDAKADRRNLIEYQVPQDQAKSLSQRSDSDVAFGENPQEWVPVSSPAFGSVTLFLGLGSFSANTDISSTSDSSAEDAEADGSHSADKLGTLSIGLEAELWVTPQWSLLAYLDQSAFSIDNPYAEGTPETLNLTRSHQGLLLGYNFLLTENFFGPKFQVFAGFGSHSTRIDSGRPVIFGSTTYTGARLGIRGDMDIPTLPNLRLGASLVFIPMPQLTTRPVISGGDSNLLTEFRLYGTYKLGERFRLYSGIDLQSYSTDFTGNRRRPDENQVNNLSQLSRRLLIGTQYMF